MLETNIKRYVKITHILISALWHLPREIYDLAIEILNKVQFSSVQSLSRVRLFATPWIAARQASLSITNSQSSLKLTSIELVMPPSHLILCHPLFLLPPIPPSIRDFSNEPMAPNPWLMSLQVDKPEIQRPTQREDMWRWRKRLEPCCPKPKMPKIPDKHQKRVRQEKPLGRIRESTDLIVL